MDREIQPVPFSFCPLCFEKYELPKILPCGHTFCKDCIQSMIKRSIKECPKCKNIFKLPGSGNTEEFPTNYDLLSAIDEISNEDVKDDTNRNNDKEQSNKLQMECTSQCIYHGMSYEFFCNTCSEQTCKNCLLDKHNPSKHKITTKSDYLEVQSRDVQKLAEQLSSLLSAQNKLSKQLADADTKCQQEAKELEEQIMKDLEIKIKRQREEADKMIKEISAENKRKRKRLKEIQEKQNWLTVKTREHQQSNDEVKRVIRDNFVTPPSKLNQLKTAAEEISRQTNQLQQYNDPAETGLHLKFRQQKRQVPSLGYLVSVEHVHSPSIWNTLSSLRETPRRILLPSLAFTILIATTIIILLVIAYSLQCDVCPLGLVKLAARYCGHYKRDEAEKLDMHCNQVYNELYKDCWQRGADIFM